MCKNIIDYCSRRTAFLLTKLKVLGLRACTHIMCRDKQKRKILYKERRAEAERDYLRRYLYALSDKTEKSTKSAPKIIWTCWWQGEKNLPPVVAKCIASMRRHCPDYELRVITSENMEQYVELPAYIMQKHKKGQITRTQLSDLLRAALLDKYGGIWMDATVFLTAPLPESITNAPFFAYHSHEIYQAQSWFLKAAPHDPIIANLKRLMFEYWRCENRMINYFLVYLSYDMVVKFNRTCTAQWAQTPLIYDDCYELEGNFFEPYDPQKWADIKARTTVHKLSWKYKKIPTKNSFLSYLLAGKLED